MAVDKSQAALIPESCFLTGTGTGVGKTFVATRLLRAFRKRGRDVVGFKPICCGDDADTRALHEACDGVIPVEQINPVWFRVPASPFTAAQIEGRVVDMDIIRVKFRQLMETHDGVLVEGAGGWKVPIRRDYFMSDLAAELALPVVVVVANRLGALNETLLAIESIRAAGCICAGYIINNLPGVEDVATMTNSAVLEDILDVPRLLTVEADLPAE